jgi:hypothetical protein
MHVAKFSPALVVAAGVVLLAGPAGSQNTGLVSVDLSKVSAQIAQRNRLDESQMPMSIQVPPAVAAAACAVPLASMVNHATRGGEGCVAVEHSPALDSAVASRMKTDEEKPPAVKPVGAPAEPR